MKIRLIITCITLAVLAGLVFGIRDGAQTVPTPENKQAASVLSLEQADRKLTLLFVGDIMLDRYVAKYIQENNDPVFPFRNVGDFLRDADITFGNLESVISDKGRNVGSIYSFRADPTVVEGLVWAGFDVLSLANNHSFDWTYAALMDTVERLRKVSILPVGAGLSYEEANAAQIVEKNGIRVGWYAFTNLTPQREGLSVFDESKSIERIRTERKEKDLDRVIVSMHWGDEYQTQSNDLQKRIAHALADGGVDIIVGHHPHVAQEVEWYNDTLILYSLGNFVFDQNFSEETMKGMAVKVTISEDDITPEYFTSYMNKRYQVERVEPDQ